MGEDDLLSDTVQPNQNSAMTRHGDAKQASGSRR